MRFSILAVGVALILVSGLMLRRAVFQTRVVPAPTRQISETSQLRRVQNQPSPSKATDVVPGSPWDALNARDYRVFISRLRAAGCPEETLVLFAFAAVARDYQERIDQPQSDWVRRSTYWRAAPSMGPQQSAEHRKSLKAEFDRAFGQLAGVEPRALRSEFMPVTIVDPIAWVGAESRARLEETRRRHEAEVSALRAGALRMGGYETLRDGQKEELRAMRERHQGELKELLGPRDFAQYQFRNSAEADFVRKYLPAASSESEFQRMVQAAFDVGMEPLELDSLDLGPLTKLKTAKGEEYVKPSVIKFRTEVLARYNELSGPEAAEVLSRRMEEENQRAEENRKAEREVETSNQLLGQLQQAAKSTGVELTADEAGRVVLAIKALREEMNQRLGPPPTSMTEAQQAEMKNRAQAEFERVMVSVVGEKGRRIAGELAR